MALRLSNSQFLCSLCLISTTSVVLTIQSGNLLSPLIHLEKWIFHKSGALPPLRLWNGQGKQKLNWSFMSKENLKRCIHVLPITIIKFQILLWELGGELIKKSFVFFSYEQLNISFAPLRRFCIFEDLYTLGHSF